MAPELVEEFGTAFHEEANRQRRDETAARAGRERELAGVRRRLEGLIDGIEGYRGPAGLQERLDDLEARKAALEREFAADPPPVRQVERRHEALAEPGRRDEALQILRGLIERVAGHAVDDGRRIELGGRFVRMVELGWCKTGRAP